MGHGFGMPRLRWDRTWFLTFLVTRVRFALVTISQILKEEDEGLRTLQGSFSSFVSIILCMQSVPSGPGFLLEDVCPLCEGEAISGRK